MAAKVSFASVDQLRNLARAQIGYGTTQRALAQRLGISDGYLSEFLSGKKGVGDAIIAALGYDPTPHYRKLKKAKKVPA